LDKRKETHHEAWHQKANLARFLVHTECSEQQLLEYFAWKHKCDPKTEGVFRIFTEAKPCGACKEVREQFEKMFPKVELVISDGGVHHKVR